MIDQEIERLAAQDMVPLDRLERDIWQKEQALRVATVASRRLASWQALVLSISVVGASITGAVTAAQAAPTSTGWFTASARLAPANLLLGAGP